MYRNLLPDEVLQNHRFDAAIIAERTITYEELFHNIDSLSAELRACGLKKGDKAALWGYNSINWLTAFFAIIKAGGTAVLLNYSYTSEMASELMKANQVGFVLAGNNARFREDSNALNRVAEMAEIPVSHCIDLRNHVFSFPAKEEETEVLDGDDTAFVILTSGTTSTPKAVELSQNALRFGAEALSSEVEKVSGQNICIAVPLFHILGLLMSFVYLRRGAAVCLPPNYKPDTLCSWIDEQAITDMAAVGAVYFNLSQHPSFEERVVPNLKLCFIAGGMSTPVQMMRLDLDYANAVFINMYGQSEAAPISMVSPSDLVEKRACSVGRAVKGLDVCIVDRDFNVLNNREIGEIVVRGGNLMNGYTGLSEGKQAIDANGWLHTGDLGYFDEEGYLHLSGRIKDIIIRGGENIAPSEIENELSKIDNIREVKVMGAPHPIFGESVEACVTLTSPDQPFHEEEIRNSLKQVLPRYKLPSHIFCYDRFPLNENGKTDVQSLRADMLMRLRKARISEELSGGVTVFDVQVKNSRISIVPVTSMVGELAANIGFSQHRINSIRLAVEEMLTERIENAYDVAGNIRIMIHLFPEWLRISFSDEGSEYQINKRLNTSLSAKIILSAVDGFHTEYHSSLPVYWMDFLYEKEIDIKDFMFRHDS